MFSGILSAYHQEFSTVHSALEVRAGFLMTASKQSQDGTAVRFHHDSAWKRSSKGCMELTSAECKELLMIRREDARKHVEFYDNKFG